MNIGHFGRSLFLGAGLSSLLVSNSFAGFKEISTRNAKKFEIVRIETPKDAENVILSFVEEIMNPGTYATVYPWPLAPRPAMSDLDGYESSYSLEVELKADAWSGGALCLSNGIDLTDYYKTGALEFSVKGTLNKEVFEVGLLDNGKNSSGNPLRVYANSRSYSIVSNKKWTKITVPLANLGKVGSYWDDEAGARLSYPFNWNATSCFSFDLFKNQFPSFNIFFDNVRLVKTYESTGPKVEGYKLYNEGY
jgi:hypothetical protein